MPPEDSSQSKKLTTWQEIAAYLGVSVRTAQNYERVFGLPVKRMPGSRGRVIAFTSDLDRWTNEGLIQNGFSRPSSQDGTEEVEPDQPEAPTVQQSVGRPVSATKAKVLALAAATIVSALALWFYWSGQQKGQPSSYTLEGRLLTVFDERNRRLWDYIFPENVTTVKSSEHPEHPYTFKFVDLDGSGRTSLLLEANGLLYCFDSTGHNVWTHKPGHEMTTMQGRIVPSIYTVLLVDVLSKPRRDGGRIVIGANRGPGATFLLEVLTADNRVVAEYFHFGWFFSIKTAVLDDSGHEDIFLGGVDGVPKTPDDYGATLVALDSDRVEGQAATVAGDDERTLRGIPVGREKAVLLIKSFAPSLDPERFCRGGELASGKGWIELKITQGLSSNPYAHFRFDRHLRLQAINPSLKLLQVLDTTLLRNVPADQQQNTLLRALGQIEYIKNDFDPTFRSPPAKPSSP